MPIYENNKIETQYLIDFYKGKQDVLNKEKHTRTEINNKIVENWTWAIIEFQTAFLLGKPIQYIKSSEKANKEVSLLNDFVKYESKGSKDLNLYEDVLSCGRGFRYVAPDKKELKNSAPFELINCDVDKTEVVYSSRLGKEQVLSFIVVPMQKMVDGKIVLYSRVEVYTKYQKFIFSNEGESKSWGLIKKQTKNLPIKQHYILEYYVNKYRLSIIEIAKDLFNSLNMLESLDMDDLEQFVNSIMVFINANVDSEKIELIKQMGAVSLSSTEGRQASLDIIQSRLNSVQTGEQYKRLITSAFEITGTPMASNSGTSMGDTGKANLVGQGFTSTSIRTEKPESLFADCDRKTIENILNICRDDSNGQIKDLSLMDIDIKFQRDMSENLLVKTQGLLNMKDSQIPREIRNSVVGLFSDPHAVTEMQNEIFGKEGIVEQENSNASILEQNKTTTNILEKQNQEI